MSSHQCIFCQNHLSPTEKYEHVLPNFLGGRMTTQTVICSKCNNDFGNTIDRDFSESIKEIRNAKELRSGDRKSAPQIKGKNIGGTKFDIEPGLKMVPKPQKIIKNPDGTTTVNAAALHPLEALIDYIKTIEKLANSRNLQGEEWLNFITKCLKECEFEQIISPPYEFEPSFGDLNSQRSMAKACLVLLADQYSEGNSLISQSTFDEIRKFVVDGTYLSEGVPLTYIDTLPLNKFDPQYGTNPNFIWVGSNNDGKVLGYFRLYNAIGFSFLLTQSGGPKNFSTALISNPYNNSIRDEGTQIAQYMTFTALEERMGIYDDLAFYKKLMELGRLSPFPSPV